MKLTTTLGTAAAVTVLGLAAHAQTMTAEGSNPGSTPLTTIITMAELASAAGIADFQVQDGQKVTPGTMLCEWDPFANPILADSGGQAKAVIADGLVQVDANMIREVGEETGLDISNVPRGKRYHR